MKTWSASERLGSWLHGLAQSTLDPTQQAHYQEAIERFPAYSGREPRRIYLHVIKKPGIGVRSPLDVAGG
jgi:hypothetical protein